MNDGQPWIYRIYSAQGRPLWEGASEDEACETLEGLQPALYRSRGDDQELFCGHEGERNGGRHVWARVTWVKIDRRIDGAEIAKQEAS